MNRLLSSIERLLIALDESNIRYCHWKSNEHLRQALEGETDLDMLFDPSQRSELERVFSECGLKRFRATPLMQYNAIEDYIGFDQKEAKIWHVHTHYRMTLGEPHLKSYTITPWGKKLLEDRIRGESNVWTTEPAEEFVILLCRIALKLRWRNMFQKLGKDDNTEIRWLKGRITNSSVERAAKRLLNGMSVENVVSLLDVKITKKSQFKPLRKALKKELKTFTAYGNLGSKFASLRREIFWLYGGVKRKLGWSNYQPSRRVSPAGGLVVAFLGCDGAGKSTTLSYVKKEFNKKLDVVSIYFGSGNGSSSLLRKPMKLVARKVGGKGIGHAVEREYEENEKVSLKSRLYSIAKIIWAITLAKEKKSKQRQMAKARNNGLLVLTDRYPQSNIAGASDGPLLYRFRKRKGILKSIADWEYEVYESFKKNAPDLAIKLVVPTKIAIDRKPEMTAEEIENKKDIVMKFDSASYSVVIDTSRPIEITRSEIMNSIWILM